MYKLLLIWVLVGSGFGFIAYQIFSFFHSVSGSRNKIKKDISLLMQVAKDWSEKLVPLDQEELALLSTKLISKRLPKGLYYTEQGLLQSIYEESLVSYAYREYNNNKSILIALTHDASFVFIKRGINIELRINEYKQGIISEEGRLMNLDGSILSEFQLSENKVNRLFIKEKEVATLNMISQDLLDQNERVFHSIKEMEVLDLNLVKAMTLYEILLNEH